MSESDPVQAILSRSLRPRELLSRVQGLFDSTLPNQRVKLLPLLPELLHALDIECAESDPTPTADALFNILEQLAPVDPDVTRGAIRSALSIGLTSRLWLPLVEILCELGEDRSALKRQVLEQLPSAEEHEKQKLLNLLCSLGLDDLPSRQAVLLTTMDSQNWRLEFRRVEALSRQTESLELLQPALTHPEEFVRGRALGALERMADLPVDIISDLLRMPVFSQSTEASGEAPQPSAILFANGVRCYSLLAEGLESNNAMVRRRSIAVIGSLKQQIPDRAIDSLLYALEDTNEHCATEAMFALLWMNADQQIISIPEAVLPMYQGVGENAPIQVRVGTAAVLALSGMQTPSIERILREGFYYDHPVVRRLAVFGIGGLANPPIDLIRRIIDMGPWLSELAERFEKRGLLISPLIDLLASALVQLDDPPAELMAILSRAGSRAAAAVLDRFVGYLQTPVDQRATVDPYQQLARVREVLTSMGQDALTTVWQMLDRLDGGESLSIAEASTLYGILCQCGGTDEAMEVLQGHPSAFVREAAARGLVDAPWNYAPGILVGFGDTEPEVRQATARTAIRFWFQTGPDDAWRERFMEATLDRMDRYHKPELVDLRREELFVRDSIGLAKVFRDLGKILRRADAALCITACHLLEQVSQRGDDPAMKPMYEIIHEMLCREEQSLREAAERVQARLDIPDPISD